LENVTEKIQMGPDFMKNVVWYIRLHMQWWQ